LKIAIQTVAFSKGSCTSISKPTTLVLSSTNNSERACVGAVTSPVTSVESRLPNGTLPVERVPLLLAGDSYRSGHSLLPKGTAAAAALPPLLAVSGTQSACCTRIAWWTPRRRRRRSVLGFRRFSAQNYELSGWRFSTLLQNI